MAQDGLANLNIDVDYENYAVITNGGDTVIINPDDPDVPIVITPDQLRAHWVSYITPEGASATNVQDALDELYDRTDQSSLTLDYNNIDENTLPTINGEMVKGNKNG